MGTKGIRLSSIALLGEIFTVDGGEMWRSTYSDTEAEEDKFVDRKSSPIPLSAAPSCRNF